MTPKTCCLLALCVLLTGCGEDPPPPPIPQNVCTCPPQSSPPDKSWPPDAWSFKDYDYIDAIYYSGMRVEAEIAAREAGFPITVHVPQDQRMLLLIRGRFDTRRYGRLLKDDLFVSLKPAAQSRLRLPQGLPLEHRHLQIVLQEDEDGKPLVPYTAADPPRYGAADDPGYLTREYREIRPTDFNLGFATEELRAKYHELALKSQGRGPARILAHGYDCLLPERDGATLRQFLIIGISELKLFHPPETIYVNLWHNPEPYRF